MRFFPLDDPVHQEVAELLPWFANGTLVGLERANVNRHVSECIACRRGLEDLRALQSAIRNDDVDSAATQAFAQLKTRIEQDDSKRPQQLRRRFVFRWTRQVWVRSLLIAQSAMLVLISIAYLSHPAPQYYRTLAAASAKPRGDMVVIFQTTASESAIRDVLLRVRASIVDGPSAEGAYTLKAREGTEQSTLSQLRRQSIVKFCEPVPQFPAGP
jgi:hypothetical protein